MTVGENIAYYLEKEAGRWSLCDWCEDHDISEEDYDIFMKAGIDAVNKWHETKEEEE